MRPYQGEAIEAHYAALKKGIKRQLFVIATGGGKTLVSCQLIDNYVKQGKRVLVLVERKVLAFDWRDEALSINPTLSIGVEMNTNKANKQNDVVVASLQTLGRVNSKRIKKFNPDHFDVVITDEAHRFPTPQGIRVLEYFQVGNKSFNPNKILIGLTATPHRADGVSLGYLFDDIVAEYPIGYLVKEGWLTDMMVYRVKTGTDISGVKVSGGDYNIKQLSKTVNVEDRNRLILKSYFDYLNGEKAIIYTADVEHAYTLQTLFEKHGVRGEVIEAETDEKKRAQWIKEFREGDLDLLLNYGTLTEGFNSTEVKGIIIARPVGSKTLLTQILGRVIRPSLDAFVDFFGTPEERRSSISRSTKPVAIVIDFDDTVQSDKILTQASLFGASPKINISGKKLFKEVIEPLERLKVEKGVDISQIHDLDQIHLITERKRLDITSLSTPPEIADLSNYTWVGAGEDTYEIMFSEHKKVLIVEKDRTKSEMLDKEEWVLCEHDTSSGITKKLQSFFNLSAAIKNADEYAERNKWVSIYKKKSKWMSRGVTESQWKLLMKLYTYKNGYSELQVLSSFYPDTGMRKLMYKKTKEILDAGLASQLIGQKLGR